jgi:predicted ATP-grasp superfamily ATP-dependent carboligase
MDRSSFRSIKRRIRRRVVAPAQPLALVMGDVDVVRALGIARIPIAFFGFPDSSARFSRHVRVTLPWVNPEEQEEELVAALLAFASSQREPPVLFPQTDAALLVASRHRERLARSFRFALADAELIEQLVDKGRFQDLAQREELPLPSARVLQPQAGPAGALAELRFPVVIKPTVRTDAWESMAGWSKALEVADPDELVAIWPRLIGLDTEILAQELVPGPESDIESFHAYVNTDGAIVGQFTGRKIRTYPPSCGHSTAVEITELPDVAELGRTVLARLGLQGVAKVDFKRDHDGRLHLLEVNPRFNLWHYPAAVAGVNLPALVYADLTGRPRPATVAVRSRVTWCKPLRDLRAAHVAGVSPLAWLRWAVSCETMSGLAVSDPLPFICGSLWTAVHHRVVDALWLGEPGGPAGAA